MRTLLMNIFVWLAVSIFVIGMHAEISHAVGEKTFQGIPLVIGLSEDEAVSILNNASISYEILDGQNYSVDIGFIYDQKPKYSNDYSHGTMIKIYRNVPKIDIYTPKENSVVNNTVVIKGHLDRNLGENDYLWIGAKSLKDIKNWWPQDNGRLIPVRGNFEANAFLGGESPTEYEIGIFIVNQSMNKKIEDWINFCKKYNVWPAITEENQYIPTLSKKILEEHKYANVTVTLNQMHPILNTSSQNL